MVSFVINFRPKMLCKLTCVPTCLAVFGIHSHVQATFNRKTPIFYRVSK